MYYFIVNPNSGSGNGLKVWNHAKKYLNSKNICYDVYFTAKQGDAMAKSAEVSKEASGDEPLYIMAVGGDGTIDEVVNGLDLSKNVIFGCIPSGSGNDLCRSLRYPQGTDEILKKIFEEGYVREMDFGVLTNSEGTLNRRFIVSCGGGFDARVTEKLESSKFKIWCNKIGIGKVAYTLVGAGCFFTNRPVKSTLSIDNGSQTEYRSVFFTSIQNHPYEGGGYKFAPNALWNDGFLDITVVNSKSRLRLMPILLNKKGGLKANGAVSFFACHECTWHFEKPVVMHVDGESMGKQTDVTVRCVKGKLRFLL